MQVSVVPPPLHRRLGLRLGELLGPLHRRFALVLALLTAAAMAPWIVGRSAHDHFEGLGGQLQVAGSLRYRLVALGLAVRGRDAGDVEELAAEQRRAFRTLLEGDAGRGIPACRPAATCDRLREHERVWTHELVPAAEAASGEGRAASGRVRELVLEELRRLDSTVQGMATSTDRDVDQLEGNGALAALAGLLLVGLVAFGTWDVFDRIRRLATATDARDPEAALHAQAHGRDEVAQLAGELAGTLGALRSLHEADRDRLALLSRQKERIGAYAERLHRWLTASSDAGEPLEEAAGAAGFDAAWLVDWRAPEPALLGAYGVPSSALGHLLARGERSEDEGLLVGEEVPEPLRRAGLRAVVRISLSWHGERVGCLAFACHGAEPSAEQLAFARALAQGFAVAALGRDLLAERQRQQRVGALLAKTTSLDDGIEALGAELRHLVAHDRALLCLRDGEGDGEGDGETMWRIDADGACRSSGSCRLPLPAGVTDGPEHRACLGGDIGQSLVAPLRAGGAATGLLVLGRRREPFTERDRERVGAVAPLVAAACARMRLEETMRENEQVAALGGITRMLAHDVRNPLNSMAMQVQLIDRRLRKLALDGQSEPLLRRTSLLADEVRRLDYLLQEYLDLARKDTWQRAPVDLSELLRRVAAEHRSDFDTQGVELTLDVPDTPATAWADRGKIAQVLRSLIRNALEAMRDVERRRLGLSLRAADRPAGWAIHVRDSGPGLAEPDKAFLASYSTKDSGSGVGLAVGRRIAQLHGGRLIARQGAGTGAELVLSLPAATASSSGSLHAPGVPAATTGRDDRA